VVYFLVSEVAWGAVKSIVDSIRDTGVSWQSVVAAPAWLYQQDFIFIFWVLSSYRLIAYYILALMVIGYAGNSYIGGAIQ